jgi:hypothetical protein
VQTDNALFLWQVRIKGYVLVQQPEDGELWVPDQSVPATASRAGGLSANRQCSLPVAGKGYR